MFVYRSIVLGLLGAGCLLLAMRPPIVVVTEGPGRVLVATKRCPARPPPSRTGPTIVDVAPGVTLEQIAQLIVLDAGESISSIDDTPVTGSLAAGVALAGIDLRARRYLDIGVSGERGARRVLVLMH